MLTDSEEMKKLAPDVQKVREKEGDRRHLTGNIVYTNLEMPTNFRDWLANDLMQYVSPDLAKISTNLKLKPKVSD